MATDRQRRLFEYIAMHGLSQKEAGEMLDHPVSQSTVHREMETLFAIHPDLKKVKDYLWEKGGFGPKSEPSGVMSYDPGMDNEVVAKF